LHSLISGETSSTSVPAIWPRRSCGPDHGGLSRPGTLEDFGSRADLRGGHGERVDGTAPRARQQRCNRARVRDRVEGFDWNCPQHITPRFTEEQIREALAPFELRVEQLERENEKLRRAAPSGG
jgi:hypothetical protein